MKKNYLKITSILLCAALITAGGGTAIHAVHAEKEEKTKKVQKVKTEKEIDETFESGDTYYVFADASGKAKKVVVSDGEEGFEEETSEKMTKNLPIDMKISYELNGKKIKPEELPGKNGKLKIKFDYQNNQYENKMINGKEEKVYVPYVVMTGMMFDNEVFKNINITNGKMIDDGEHTSVMCFALPGLLHNLNIDKNELDLPESIEISADVKDFEMMETMTITTNEIFNDVDSSKTGKYDDLNSSLDQLKNAMGQLIDGSSSLYNGLDLLLEKSGQLKSGILQLSNGTTNLVNGVSQLDEGVSALQSGASQLSKGLSTLSSNNKMLTDGAAQTFQAILQSANEQIAAAGLEIPKLTISNYESVLNNVIASLDKNAVYTKVEQQVKAAVEQQRPAIEKAVTEAVRAKVQQQVKQAVLAQLGMESVPDEALNPMIVKMIESKTNEMMQSDEIKEQIRVNTDLQVQQIISEKMASDEIQAKLAEASNGAKKLIEVKALLDNYNAFYVGIITYTNGVADAAGGAGRLNSGINDLKNGTTKLKSGAGELNNGVQKLAGAAPELINGVSQLRDGSMKLSDGLKEFDEEGVKKLTEAAKDDLGVLIERINATLQTSKDYNPFSGTERPTDDPVRFIYRTESIK